MRITQGEIVDLQTVLHIEMEDEDVRPYIDIGYQRVKPHISFPGFRKGRVPRHIVLQFMGREALLNEVLDTMLPEVTGRAIDEQELEPGGMPDVEVLDLDPVTFKATVPLKPQVELGDYRDIRVEVEQSEIGEEDVQERLESLRNSMASWEPVERPVKMDDLVTITATGAVEGDTILDEADIVYLLTEDTDIPFPGFSEALVGAVLDTPKEFELTVSDDFPVDEYVGKPVQVTVTVSDVKERILPELDEEFAQGIGEGYDSIEALREQIKEELETESQNASEEEMLESAISSLIEGADAVIPPAIIEHEVERMLNEQMQTLARINIRFDDYLRSLGRSEEEMREEMREQAITRIKRVVALEKLGEVEGVDVTDEDVEERIASIIAQNLEQYPDVLEESEIMDALEEPEITDDVRSSVRRLMHSELVTARLVAIAKGEAPDIAVSAEESEAEGTPDETAKTESKEE